MNEKQIIRFGALLLAGTAVAGLVASQTARNAHAEPYHTVKDTDGDFEIRNYASGLAAEVEVEGARLQAIQRGFRLLADFIFGHNAPSDHMTAQLPAVTKAQKIPMTTPVLQQQGEGQKWTVQFIMPQEYTLDTLPKPTNPIVSIRELPARQVAVLRFSGSTKNTPHIEEQTRRLGHYMAEKSLKPAGTPVLAFYDPPWTLPFMRRNEVMVELDTQPTSAKKKKS